MNITERRFKTSVDYTVQGDEIEVILTAPINEDWPEQFSLYIWKLSFDNGKELLKTALREITKRNIRNINWSAGNGHGLIDVSYE